MQQARWADRLAATARSSSAAAILFCGPAFAQQPTQAQISAIRGSCRSDYRAVCASVPTGGMAALNCLRENAASLSPSCRAAVEAAGGGGHKNPQRSEAVPALSGAVSATSGAASAMSGANPGAEQTGDAQWPHTVTVDGARVVVYQPQVIEWPGKTSLTARAAIEVTPSGGKPFLGTIDIVGDTQTDFATRSVLFSHPRLLASHFPSLDTGRAARVEARVREVLASTGVKRIPLDTVLLGLAGSSGTMEDTTAIRNTPPTIFTSDRPAVLVVFDGDPVLVPVSGTGLRTAVNTNWTVLTDPATGAWYLLTNGVWSTATDYHGPWRVATALPASFSRLPAEAAFEEARRAATSPGSGPPPAIFVATVPAEIIITDGAPVFAAIPGTSLQYVSNTASDLFRAGDGTFYYLTSGRWFAAPGLNGPWRFATPDLPADFGRIPPDSPRARVLASVPGSEAAQLAVLQAGVPRQATLSRKGPTVAVSYAGPPRFVPIPGTTMLHAVNSPYGVIKVGNRFYLCWQGAWFTAPTPTGPWLLAASVPAVIYTIPPASPLYPVTAVRIYAVTPTTVTYGYTSAYALGFVSAGVLVYGTGYVYPPVVIPGPVPVYFPYPATYSGGYVYNTASGAYVRGGSVSGPYGGAHGSYAYNPATGAYAAGGAVYGPYGGAGGFSAYNPSTGSYAHGSGSWGAYGGSGNASFYNARTGVSGSTTQNANAYGRWGSSSVSGPNKTVNTASGSNARGSAGGFQSSTGAEGAGVHGAHGNNAGVARSSNGDVYAGANGHAYQHTSSGWSKWSNGGWTPVQTSGSTRQTGSTGGSTWSSNRASSSGNSLGSSSASSSGNLNSQLNRDRSARLQGSGSGSGSWQGASRGGWGQGRFAGGRANGQAAGGWARGEGAGGRFRR